MARIVADQSAEVLGSWRRSESIASLAGSSRERYGPSAVEASVRLYDLVPHHLPSFTIGLAAWLTVLEALHLRTGRPAYRVVFEFWLKIFGVAFGSGSFPGS